MSRGTYLSTILLLLTGAVGGLMVTSGNITPKHRRDVPETLCGEVQHELTQQVLAGMLTESNADAIVARCIKLYGHQPRDPR